MKDQNNLYAHYTHMHILRSHLLDSALLGSQVALRLREVPEITVLVSIGFIHELMNNSLKGNCL